MTTAHLTGGLAILVALAFLLFLCMPFDDDVPILYRETLLFMTPSSSTYGHVAQRTADLLHMPISFTLVESNNVSHTTVWTPTQEDRRLAAHMRHTVRVRPIVGDHIHQDLVVEVLGQRRPMFHDRDVVEVFDYREYPKGAACMSPEPWSYKKVHVHTGVHTHCHANCVHVHPYSQDRMVRREGLDVRLGLFFDAVGMRYHDYPTRLKFCDACPWYASNRTHAWELYQWTVPGTAPRVVRETHLDRVWLVHAGASIYMRYGRRGQPLPTPTWTCRTLQMTSFNNRTYPN